MWKKVADTLLRMAESWALLCPDAAASLPPRWPRLHPRFNPDLCMQHWLATWMPYAAAVAQCSAQFPDQFYSDLPPRVGGVRLFSQSDAPNGYIELQELPDRVLGRIVFPDGRSFEVGGALRNIQAGSVASYVNDHKWVLDLEWWDGVHSGRAQLYVLGNRLSGEWARSDGVRGAWRFQR
jgi:hypothetical protein